MKNPEQEAWLLLRQLTLRWDQWRR